MRFFSKASDGGKYSGVTGFFLVEIKPLFSIVLLHFRPGTREAYHSHAFNALTWWLKGVVCEERPGDRITDPIKQRYYSASWYPKYTPRENCHRVNSLGHSYAISFRGPWKDTWHEIRNGQKVTLTHGRKIVNGQDLPNPAVA